jgi:hypothetical protein
MIDSLLYGHRDMAGQSVHRGAVCALSGLSTLFTSDIERRHHFLRDHVEKGNIEMRYIDTERQLTDIFNKPLDASRFTNLRGELVFAIRITWFEGELVLYLVYCIFFFSLTFFHTQLSHFASLVILACICLIIFITVLG